MNLLCQYTLYTPYTGIKYLPNNDLRAVSVSENGYVCLLEVQRNLISLIGSCLNLGVTYLNQIDITQDGTKGFVGTFYSPYYVFYLSINSDNITLIANITNTQEMRSVCVYNDSSVLIGGE